MAPLWPVLGINLHHRRVLLVCLGVIASMTRMVSKRPQTTQAVRLIYNLHSASLEDSHTRHAISIGDHDTSTVATVSILDRLARVGNSFELEVLAGELVELAVFQQVVCV